MANAPHTTRQIHPTSTWSPLFEGDRYQSGIPLLDDQLGGGFVRGALVVISGPAGSGKATLLNYLASMHCETDDSIQMTTITPDAVITDSLFARRERLAKEGMTLQDRVASLFHRRKQDNGVTFVVVTMRTATNAEGGTLTYLPSGPVIELATHLLYLERTSPVDEDGWVRLRCRVGPDLQSEIVEFDIHLRALAARPARAVELTPRD